MTKVYMLDGSIVKIGDWDFMECADGCGGVVDTNPLPEGAIEVDVELATTARGSIVLADDYEALRYDEYPPMRDQLDALWKGGDAASEMAAQVQAVKDKYPKP